MLYTNKTKHNDIQYVVAAAKYHSFPTSKKVENKPKLRTNFELNPDYTVKTMECLK
jgi:hypothetical protein